MRMKVVVSTCGLMVFFTTAFSFLYSSSPTIDEVPSYQNIPLFYWRHHREKSSSTEIKLARLAAADGEKLFLMALRQDEQAPDATGNSALFPPILTTTSINPHTAGPNSFTVYEALSAEEFAAKGLAGQRSGSEAAMLNTVNAMLETIKNIIQTAGSPALLRLNGAAYTMHLSPENLIMLTPKKGNPLFLAHLFLFNWNRLAKQVVLRDFRLTTWQATGCCCGRWIAHHAPPGLTSLVLP